MRSTYRGHEHFMERAKVLYKESMISTCIEHEIYRKSAGDL